MWQGVAMGNIQQMSYIPQTARTAFALWAHAAPSGECNYYVCVCESVYGYVCM